MKNNPVSLACAFVALACPVPALAGASNVTPPRVVHTVLTVAPKAAHALSNYSDKLDHRLSWPSLPVRVFFVPDKNYSTEREEIAKDGFDRWTKATDGFVRYNVTRLPQRADIFVRFDPDMSGGLTKTHFRKGRLFRADMRVGVAHDEGDDIECTAAHEFGHALGIDGHSDDRADLMFPIHVIGRPFSVTQRDVNTLATAYQALAKKLATQLEARVGGPGYNGMGM